MDARKNNPNIMIAIDRLYFFYNAPSIIFKFNHVVAITF